MNTHFRSLDNVHGRVDVGQRRGPVRLRREFKLTLNPIRSTAAALPELSYEHKSSKSRDEKKRTFWAVDIPTRRNCVRGDGK